MIKIRMMLIVSLVSVFVVNAAPTEEYEQMRVFELRRAREQQEQRNEQLLNALSVRVPHIEVRRQQIARDLFGARGMIVDDLLRDENGNVHEDEQMGRLFEALGQRGLRLVVDSARGRDFLIVRNNVQTGDTEIPVNEIRNIPLGENVNNVFENQEQALRRIENRQHDQIVATRINLDRLNRERRAREEIIRERRARRLNQI